MSEKETKTPRGYSTVNVHTVELANLSVIALVSKKDKSTILNEFIDALYKSVFPHVGKAIAEKRTVIFDYNIMATIKEPTVFKSRKVDFRKSNEQLDREMIEDAEKEFAKLEGKPQKKKVR